MECKSKFNLGRCLKIGTINILSKEKADMIIALGFKCSRYKINSGQVVYSFIDTPEIRKALSCNFNKNDFYINNTVYM
jgi:hypothetical protein